MVHSINDRESIKRWHHLCRFGPYTNQMHSMAARGEKILCVVVCTSICKCGVCVCVCVLKEMEGHWFPAPFTSVRWIRSKASLTSQHGFGNDPCALGGHYHCCPVWKCTLSHTIASTPFQSLQNLPTDALEGRSAVNRVRVWKKVFRTE